ncbi:hypothetical protein EIP91_006858 [Steccherinum ochraceum]|uniref:Uncharacterized protein n=1 Tax=Steccherinum ochraceum TaxID=92696 RepID=A0A4R0RQZ9_9APHY|nr:hypothetical protein EIP91_006858 [Steccherinum ochraceum]
MSERPATSKARGICKYYNSPRGCFAGKHCKFLHGQEEKITPYDKAKPCKFFAAGYCKRGADCWFSHIPPTEAAAGTSQSAVHIPTELNEDENLCCICLEKPVTYGLLAGCSHIYCIQCIRDWRDSTGKSFEMVSSGNTKKCPLCRALSPFVTPSSHFYPDGHAGKVAIIDQYKASMARVACKHFQRSPKSNRYCPFGRDCFYQHLNSDGTPFVFDRGVSFYIKQARRRHYDDNEDDDPDQSPWLQELSTALDAIRASVPHVQQDADDNEDEPEDWIANASEGEAGTPAYARAHEALAHLTFSSPSTVSRTALSEPGSPTHTFNFHRGPGDTTPLILSPLLQPADPMSMIPHPSHTTGARFSTVVHGRMPDYVIGNVGDWNPIPWTASIFSAAELPGVLDFPDQHPPLPTPTANDLEALILQHPPSLSGQATEVIHDPPASESTANIDTAPLHISNQPPAVADAWDTPAPTAQESDPPLLTDGRGRVVWSTTPASRRGRGRATSSALPTSQQHKARLREESLGSEVARDHAADQTRSPHMVRARTFPELPASGEVRSSSQLQQAASLPSRSLLLVDGLDS